MREADEGVDVVVGVVVAVTKSSWFRLGARCQMLGQGARVGPWRRNGRHDETLGPVWPARERVIPTYNVCSTTTLHPG